jgi:hypothetical protein
MENRELARLRLQVVPKERTHRTRPINPALGPTKPGQSELEKLTGPAAQIRHIQVLASHRDDPRAWASLANGFRIRALREPIKAAIRDVGSDKVLNLVSSNPGAWPDGLEEFLVEERRRYLAGLGTGKLAGLAVKYGDYGTDPD